MSDDMACCNPKTPVNSVEQDYIDKFNCNFWEALNDMTAGLI